MKNKNNLHIQEKEQIGTVNFPLFIKGEIHSIKNEEETRDEMKERKAKSETDAKLVEYTGLLALFTFLLFFFTAALWWVTYRLSVASKEAGARQAEEMEKSLAIAKEAAQAAISGNELNKKIFISSQRPWVTVQEIIPRSPLNFNEHGLAFTMIARNVGHSPAINVNICAVMHLSYIGNINAHQLHKNMREELARERKELVSNEVDLGHLIVPGEELEIQVRAGYSLAEYQKAALNHPFSEIIILIIGQVSYGSGLDESQYESGFIFSVRRRGGAGILFDDSNMPIEVEIRRFSSGFYTT
ncbi:hypothetical protein ABF87_10680 [Nitrosomonas sp. JL21]|nr:hypothetical protein [Nitrosomonas sp. JL21]